MGIYSDQPDPPVYYAVVDTRDCVRYTDPSQAKWFMDRIQYAYGGDTDARLEGNTIRWFGYYRLEIGDWLYAGTTPMSDEILKSSAFRPNLEDWPPEGA